ncbi:hypothetical protein SPWS13_2701 [Shewanella putrefaciens]|nr:hypothetical protein SPWS13_2701 [Shewanella putrefaciens]
MPRLEPLSVNPLQHCEHFYPLKKQHPKEDIHDHHIIVVIGKK